MIYKLLLILSLTLHISYILPAQQYLSEAKYVNKPIYTLRAIKPNKNIPSQNLVKKANVEQLSDTPLRLHPDALDKNATLLLYLKNPANSARLSITDMLGNTVNVPMEGILKGGFHEIATLPKQPAGGIYIVRLIIDDKIYSRRIIR